MQIIITGKNVAVTDHLRTYIEKRFSKLDRFLPNIEEARVELSEQKTKSAGDRRIVQLTLRSSGITMRAEERSADIQTSIDAVLDKMSRQIERYKGKHWQSYGRPEAEQPEAGAEEGEVEGEVVRVKRFQTRPMGVDDAIQQMELLGHDFFAFFNVDNDAFNVVYRRRDGGYGLLIPEMA